MSLVPKQQVVILSVSALLAFFSLVSILNFTDPYSASGFVFIFFYLSLGLVAFASLSLAALGIKRWLWPKIFVNDFSLSIRQGLLMAIFVTLSVALQLHGLLFWWLELSLIIFLIVLEVFANLKS